MARILPPPGLINLPYRLEREPPPFEGNDIKSSESLFRYFINHFTKPGDRVFDPFAGLGTTLFVAEALKRVPFGIEYDAHRLEWVAGQMDHWMNMACGDAGSMDKMGFPKMDFCMTCPPYMRASDTWNPLYGGNPKYAGYDKYLRRMGAIFARLPVVMKRGAYVVVNVDNIPGKIYTPLVRDLSCVIEKSMRLDGEAIIQWTGKHVRDDYTHTRALVFRVL